MDGGGWGTLGRTLIGVGLGIAVLGGVLLLVGRATGGRGLPGDFVFGRGTTRVVFPLASMLLLSVILTVVLNLLARWKR